MKKGIKWESSVLEVLILQIPTLCNALMIVLEQKTDGSLKQVKPLLGCVKEALVFILSCKIEHISKETSLALSSLIVPLRQLQAMMVEGSQQKTSSGGLKAVEECVGLIDKVQALTKIDEGGKKIVGKKGKEKESKKRKTDAVVEAAAAVIATVAIAEENAVEINAEGKASKKKKHKKDKQK
jgi:hypothetical protein